MSARREALRGALRLALVGLGAAALLAGVHALTRAPIAQQAARAQAGSPAKT